MNYTINEIPDEAVELSGNEMIPIWQGETKKVSVATLASSGIPVGAVMPFANGTTSEDWLLCDGRDTTGTTEELQTHYPALYTYLGDSNILPDYRECVLVGVGQNTTDTIADHDVYTLGEFKDDQLQGHWHQFYYANAPLAGGGASWQNATNNQTFGSNNAVRNPVTDGTNGTPRYDTTTHGKQKGVAYYIKAK